MILMIGFYADADPARRGEFLECIRRNTANTHIEEIVIFVEDETTSASVRERFPVLGHAKIRLLEYGRRIRYSQLFKYANLHLKGTVFIVANADVFFDETLALLEEEPLAGGCFAFLAGTKPPMERSGILSGPTARMPGFSKPRSLQLRRISVLGNPGATIAWRTRPNARDW
jgi:hypothetical protein